MSELPTVHRAPSAAEQSLTPAEWKHIRIVSEAFAAACHEDPDGQAGVARRLGKSKNFIFRCCDPNDPQTLPSRYIGLLPHVVARVYLSLLGQAYRRAGQAIPDVRPDFVAADLASESVEALRVMQRALADGKVSLEELHATELALNAIDTQSALCRILMRRIAGKDVA